MFRVDSKIRKICFASMDNRRINWNGGYGRNTTGHGRGQGRGQGRFQGRGQGRGRGRGRGRGGRHSGQWQQQHTNIFPAKSSIDDDLTEIEEIGPCPTHHDDGGEHDVSCQNSSVVRIAIEGCCHGEIQAIYARLQRHDRESGKRPIDLLICCGDFESLRNLADLHTIAVPPKYLSMGSFYKYYSGEEVAPYLTVFVSGNHEASQALSELYYGGWVAPNIYYLGAAGVVNFCGLRIGGISGIYKSHDYRVGRHERPPYDRSALRSIYHVRNVDVYRLLSLSQQPKSHMDIFVSHEWPQGIDKYGNTQELLRRKPYFRSDIEQNMLGSPPHRELLWAIKPKWWFAAHLHVKFKATLKHATTTKLNQAKGAQKNDLDKAELSQEFREYTLIRPSSTIRAETDTRKRKAADATCTTSTDKTIFADGDMAVDIRSHDTAIGENTVGKDTKSEETTLAAGDAVVGTNSQGSTVYENMTEKDKKSEETTLAHEDAVVDSNNRSMVVDDNTVNNGANSQDTYFADGDVLGTNGPDATVDEKMAERYDESHLAHGDDVINSNSRDMAEDDNTVKKDTPETTFADGDAVVDSNRRDLSVDDNTVDKDTNSQETTFVNANAAVATNSQDMAVYDSTLDKDTNRQETTCTTTTHFVAPRGEKHPQCSSVPDLTDQMTQFLSLDKCLPRRHFLTIVNVPVFSNRIEKKDAKLEYDLEWLAILRKTHHLSSRSRGAVIVPSHHVQVNENDLSWVRERFSSLQIPENFVPTVPPMAPGMGVAPLPPILPPPLPQMGNPQTDDFLRILELDHVITVPFTGLSSTAGVGAGVPRNSDPIDENNIVLSDED